jgi:hypothetical protein
MAGVGGLLAKQFKLISLLAAVSALAALVFTAYALTPGPPAPAVSAPPENLPAPAPSRVEVAAGRTEALTGQVFGTDGRPVPRAFVTALIRRPWLPAGRGLQDVVVARGTTDAEGHYRLTVPADFPTWYPERRVTLLAHADGLAPVTGSVVLRGQQAATDLHLPGGTAVRGRLLRPDGGPAGGVRLTVVRLGHAVREISQGDDHPPAPPGWPADVRSGADGRFQMEGLAAGDNLWLQVQDDRYALSTFQVAAGAAEPVTVTLSGPRLLIGRVVAEDTGRVVHGARLSVLVGPWQKNHDHYTRLGAVPEAVSVAPLVELSGRADAQGRFRLRLPPETAYRVYVYPPEGGDYLGRNRQLAWAEGETSRELMVALPAGIAVRGQVIEEDGRPIDGACVSWIAAGSRDNPSLSDAILFRDTATSTGADGRFRIVVPTGPCRLEVSGPTAEYRLHDYTLQRCPTCGFEHVRTGEHRRLELNLEPGARPDPVQVTLRRGTTVTGRAIGPDGEAIREGVVVCRTIVHPLRSPMPRTLPIRDGVFELPGCIPGRTYPVLLLDAARLLAAVTEVHLPPRGEPATTVRLTPCGTAEVRLVDADGQPLAGHRPFIHFWLGHDRPIGDPQPTDDRLRPDPIYPSWIDPLHYLPGPATDAKGLVVLPAVVPGLEYNVEFLIGERRRYRTKLFRVTPGQFVQLPEVVVPRDPEDGAHAGDKP